MTESQQQPIYYCLTISEYLIDIDKTRLFEMVIFFYSGVTYHVIATPQKQLHLSKWKYLQYSQLF